MNYQVTNYRSEWLARLALVVIAAALLPMSPNGQQGPAALAEKPREGDAVKDAKTAWPRVMKSSPEKGAADVDPTLTEIAVTFDRDMDTGMSWTGGAPLFPPVDKTRQARWTDARTCVLPVKLEPGSYYRLGINSSSYRNFRSSDGTPAEVAAIYFATQNASDEVKARLRVPKIVKMEPENAAKQVDPAMSAVSVTFDVPMGGGMSWTGGDPQFPKVREGQAAKWSDDGLTCVLPVALEPGRRYELGLNNNAHNNFQSRWGVPLEPVAYQFQTSKN